MEISLYADFANNAHTKKTTEHCNDRVVISKWKHDVKTIDHHLHHVKNLSYYLNLKFDRVILHSQLTLLDLYHYDVS